MNILTFSDLHIAHKMIDKEVLDNLVSDIKRLVKPDSIIVFCGDLMHKKVEFNDIYAQQAIELLKEIDNLTIPAYFIEGTYSHDYKYIDTVSKIQFKNIHFIRTVTEMEIKNNLNEKLKVLFVPEEYVSDQNEYYKDTIYNKRKKYDLVVMHGTFNDVLFHNVNIEKQPMLRSPRFESSDFERHTLTLSGHIHKHQVLGKKKNVIYVGSYSMMNFGDDKSNNILSVDIDKDNKTFEYKVYENTASQTFEDITVDESNKEKFENEILTKIKNKTNRHNIRVFLKLNDNLITNILKELKKDGYIRSLITESVDENVIKESQEQEEVIDYSAIYNGKIEEQIKTYIMNKYSIDMDLDKIKNYLE